MNTSGKVQRLLIRTRRHSLQPTRPSWISGAARLVDLGGVFDRYALRPVMHQSESDALASDWAKVGADLMKALHAPDLHNSKR